MRNLTYPWSVASSLLPLRVDGQNGCVHQQRVAIVEAPSVLGLFPSGVSRLPEALLGAGLLEKLGGRVACHVEPAAYEPQRD